MKRIKNWILQLSIRKKLVFYSYLIITPILLLISILLLLHNYWSAVQFEEERYIQSAQNISDSINVVQTNIMEMGTYISINEEIKKILTVADPGEWNRDARLWLNHAPMKMIQDMVAIDGQIKTIAMDNFKQGDFSQKVEVMAQDEVGEAPACFNRMVDDIKELIDRNYVMAIRERESELR